jgi:hypothetical protein
MSVGSGLNPSWIVLMYATFLGLLGWKCLRIVYAVIVNVRCVLYHVTLPGGLFILLYYLVLILYACHDAACTVPSCLYICIHLS